MPSCRIVRSQSEEGPGNSASSCLEMKAPALLIAERLAISNGFELLDQFLAVDEESSAGLVAAEAVQQLDGLPGV